MNFSADELGALAAWVSARAVSRHSWRVRAPRSCVGRGAIATKGPPTPSSPLPTYVHPTRAAAGRHHRRGRGLAGGLRQRIGDRLVRQHIVSPGAAKDPHGVARRPVARAHPLTAHPPLCARSSPPRTARTASLRSLSNVDVSSGALACLESVLVAISLTFAVSVTRDPCGLARARGLPESRSATRGAPLCSPMRSPPLTACPPACKPPPAHMDNGSLAAQDR